MSKKSLLLMILATFLFSNCGKPDCSAPNPFTLYFFYFSKDGDVDYLNDRGIYEKLKISYLNERNEKKFIDYSVALGYDWEEYDRYLFTRDFTKVSGIGVKEFYFEYQNNTDTLYLDVEGKPHPECEGYIYTFKEIRFNGKPVTSRKNELENLTYELFSND